MPPNGYGCRCEAIQLPGGSYTETPDKKIVYPPVPEMFKVNFGQRGIAFPPGHSYFKRMPKEYEEQVKTMARGQVRRIIANAQQYKAYLDNPEYKDVAFDYTNGGLKASHVHHNFNSKGVKSEYSVQSAGYKEGHSVVFGREKFGAEGETFTEGEWDGISFEVSGRHTCTSNNILKGFKHCASKKAEIAILDYPDGGFDMAVMQKTIGRYKGLVQKEGYFRFSKVICVQNDTIVLESEL